MINYSMKLRMDMGIINDILLKIQFKKFGKQRTEAQIQHSFLVTITQRR